MHHKKCGVLVVCKQIAIFNFYYRDETGRNPHQILPANR